MHAWFFWTFWRLQFRLHFERLLSLPGGGYQVSREEKSLNRERETRSSFLTGHLLRN